jgi:hypothetical protein
MEVESPDRTHTEIRISKGSEQLRPARLMEQALHSLLFSDLRIFRERTFGVQRPQE